MPIDWSTEHPTPNFPENTFGSEAEHVKSIYQFLLTDVAYMNPLADDIATMVARIDAVQALLATEMSASLSDYNTFAGFAAGGGSISTPDVNSICNLKLSRSITVTIFFKVVKSAANATKLL